LTTHGKGLFILTLVVYSDNNYPQYIYSYLYNHSLEEDIQDILGQYTNNRIPFSRLPLLDKISILQELVDSVFETGAALQWKNTLRPEDMVRRKGTRKEEY
jgi:hypothetical protein